MNQEALVEPRDLATGLATQGAIASCCYRAIAEIPGFWPISSGLTENLLKNPGIWSPEPQELTSHHNL